MSEEGPMQLEKRIVKPPKNMAERGLEDVSNLRVGGIEDVAPPANIIKSADGTVQDMRMTTRVSGAKLLRNLDENADTLKELLGEEHFRNMRVVGRVLEVIQRVPISADSPEVLKASKMTIGGMTSRLYAVFSGRVSWRYVGAEALFLNMAKNDAYAITAILANPEAAKAIAYMAVTGKPIINKLTTSDKMTAWIPEVFIASSEEYRDQWERNYEETRYIRRARDRESKEKVGKQMEELFVGS